MGWILKAPEDFRERKSEEFNLNMLYKKGKIYVMDNHLAAGWCWLQDLDSQKEYNFFHIDQHPDMQHEAPIDAYMFLKDQQRITLQEYLKLEYPIKPEGTRKVFHWANYIKQIHKIYPGWFKECKIAIHECFTDRQLGDFEPLNVTYNCDYFELHRNMKYWILDSAERKKREWIVNLDLDYFFDEEGMQIASDDYVRAFAHSLGQAMDNVAVLTIALSPECCAPGELKQSEKWERSLRILKLVSAPLGINVPLPS